MIFRFARELFLVLRLIIFLLASTPITQLIGARCSRAEMLILMRNTERIHCERCLLVRQEILDARKSFMSLFRTLFNYRHANLRH